MVLSRIVQQSVVMVGILYVQSFLSFIYVDDMIYVMTTSSKFVPQSVVMVDILYVQCLQVLHPE